MNKIKKHCVLVQAHKSISYILQMAKINPDVNFYVHLDKKSNIEYNDFLFKNIFFIKNRIDVKWGGISQILATLSLFNEAIENQENFYFHLISGECVFLNSFLDIKMDEFLPEFFIDIRFSKEMRYRTRFISIFADTKFQRSLFGKLFTFLNKTIDRLIPSRNDDYAYFGSQWFSLNRLGMEILLEKISKEYIDFFRKKLCPDEHFFQILIKKNKLDKYVKPNHRYLFFRQGENSPKYLSYEDLVNIDLSDFWIARKVDEDVAMFFLKQRVSNED